MSLTTDDKQYIEKTITKSIINNNGTLIGQFQKEMGQLRSEFKTDMTKSRLEFQKDSERYMGALKEGFQDQVNMLAELIKERPTRSEVVDMIHEHTRPIVRQETYKSLRSEFAPFMNEMRMMRRNHENRIGKLETAAQH